jgi:Kef-type K+ transport system membrane component KefB
MNVERIAIGAVAGFAAVLALSAILSWLCRRIRQPAVIGQVLVGILLGPSGLGRLPGDPPVLVFPAQVRPFLAVAAQFGVILFLFTEGYELDLRLLAERRLTVMAVSVGGLLFPLTCGIALGAALWAWPHTGLRPPAVSGLAFTLFIAVALAITAVPVLAAILTETGLRTTRAGTVALASAGVIDAVGWLLLAGVIAVTGGEQFSGGRIAGLAAYAAAMTFVARPVLRRWLGRTGGSGLERLFAAVALAMMSAWATGELGLHLVFGALVAGLVMPRGADGLSDPVIAQPASHAGQLLLPLFFIVTGLSVDLSALHGGDLLVLAVSCVLAVAGKLGGAAAAARFAGLPSGESALIGALLNTRGLTELIVLNLGLQVGLLGTRIYSILVSMALVTTAMTGPLVHHLTRSRGRTPVETGQSGQYAMGQHRTGFDRIHAGRTSL